MKKYRPQSFLRSFTLKLLWFFILIPYSSILLSAQEDNTTTGHIAGNIIINANSYLDFRHSNDYTYGGVISGAGSVYKVHSSKTTLTGANTFSGKTQITAGILQVGNGSSTTVSLSSTSSIDVQAGAFIRFEPGNNMTFTKVISGAGSLQYSGSNTKMLILSGANIYSGSTSVLAGTLQVGNGTLAAATISATSGIVISSGAIMRFEPGVNMTFANVISGAGSVQYLGSSNKFLILTGNNTYTGTTTVDGNGAALYIGNGTNTGSIEGNIVLNNSGAWADFRRTNDITYSGVISGSGNINKYNAGKLTLTGANTFTGSTTVSAGTLQVGNSSSTTASLGTTSGISISSDATIRFEPNTDMTFSKVISGSGKLESAATSNKILLLTGNNTYTGTTTISSGILSIGNNSTSGSIAGNIVNNSVLYIRRSNNYTFSGVISGTGEVHIAAGNTTFTGANTYFGNTYINDATLTLGVSGSILNSDTVNFRTFSGTLDITAGDKKIKNVSIANTNTTISLGTRTLTIGTSATSNDGNGSFSGKFTGTGAVNKTGLGTLTVGGANTATGLLSLDKGKIIFSQNWAGSFKQSAGTNLTVTGNVSIGGTLTLQGGTIQMNLIQTPNSKITAAGAATVTGTNTITILASGAVTNYTLIHAVSGISSINPYTLDMPGFDVTLNATGTLLNLTATPTVIFVPVTNITGVPTNATAGTPLTLTGTVAPSNATNTTIVWSVTNAGTTGATITNDNILNTTGSGTVIVTGTIINGLAVGVNYTKDFSISVNKVPQTPPEAPTLASKTATNITLNEITGCEYRREGGVWQASTAFNGLTPNTAYIFQARKAETAMYSASDPSATASFTTDKAVLAGMVTINGNAVFGETLTVNTSALTSDPQSALGTLSYQWQKAGVNVGANNTYYTLVAEDIGFVFTVIVTSSNCYGSVTSETTEVVIKANQAAPEAPALSSKTATSVILNEMEGCEFRMNEGAWQASNLFEGLSPRTAYNFEARKTETDTHFASEPSPVATFTTDELSISANTLDNILVYSHQNNVYIKNEGNITLKSVEILDLNGRVIYRNVINDMETIVSLSVSNGIYMVRLISCENKLIVKKVSIHI